MLSLEHQEKNFTHLSCPIVSPEPSSLAQPADVELSSPSHASSSGAVMFTRSLNSLAGGVEVSVGGV